jgi:hypothetical protein
MRRNHFTEDVSVVLLPLHVAFVWILKTHPAVRLSFAALTIGALVPDIEPLFTYLTGASVFCWWNFPCTLAPDRLVLHSLVGAVTVDVALTVLFVKIISALRPERIGINGFRNVNVNAEFCWSAAVGSTSHVLVDWLHHSGNPVFWPFLVGEPPSHYVGGLLLPYMGVGSASFMLAIIAGAVLVFLAARATISSPLSLSRLIFDPKTTMNLVTESLDRRGKD